MKKTHNRTVVLFTLITLIAIIFFSCSPNEPTPNPPEPTPEIRDTLRLTLTDKTHRSVTLNVKTTANAEGYAKNKIKLIRKPSGGEGQDTLVAEYSAATLDTTIIDDNDGEGLRLETSYVYYAVRIDSANAEKDSSAFVTAQTLGATSHDYAWEEIIIGDDGFTNALYDVWGTDENNVYAVGSVRIDGIYYGVIHWDGEKWEGSRKKGGQYAIFGFSENDIWSVGASVNHFDGNTWTKIDDNVLQSNIEYRAVWGTSSENIYFGNIWGKIVHWDGSRGSLEELPISDRVVTDINGLNNQFIVAVGYSLLPPSLALLYNGTDWKEFFAVNTEEAVSNVSIINRYEIFFGGDGVFHLVRNQFSRFYNTGFYVGDTYYDRNTGELFVVGVLDGIQIYNGKEWNDYTKQISSDGAIYHSVIVLENTVFIVGRNPTKAKIIIGRRN